MLLYGLLIKIQFCIFWGCLPTSPFDSNTSDNVQHLQEKKTCKPHFAIFGVLRADLNRNKGQQNKDLQFYEINSKYFSCPRWHLSSYNGGSQMLELRKMFGRRVIIYFVICEKYSCFLFFLLPRYPIALNEKKGGHTIKQRYSRHAGSLPLWPLHAYRSILFGICPKQTMTSQSRARTETVVVVVVFIVVVNFTAIL